MLATLALALAAYVPNPLHVYSRVVHQEPLNLRMADALPAEEKCSFVLLAGGSGSRMKADRPKQFLDLLGKPVLQWDLELLLDIDGIDRVVLVIAEEFRSMDFLKPYASNPRLSFADPGKERQNSVENGLAGVSDDCTLVAIHDAARPLVTRDSIYRCFSDAAEHGAAVLAVPCKPTIKESADGEFVLKTLDRSRLWDIQTPQIMRPQMLRDGFANANKKGERPRRAVAPWTGKARVAAGRGLRSRADARAAWCPRARLRRPCRDGRRVGRRADGQARQADGRRVHQPEADDARGHDHRGDDPPGSWRARRLAAPPRQMAPRQVRAALPRHG